jgi:divalent metal cation (Fe/Co/Zn/Cd) transporter
MTLTQRRAVAAVAAIVGIILIVVAVFYFVEPAHALPSILPGREAGSNHHHVKHGIAALLVGIVALIFAWFQTAPPKQKPAA